MTSRIENEVKIICHLNDLVKKFEYENKNKHPAYAYFEPIDSLSLGLPVPIYGAMLLIWQLRDKDLQILYPLDTHKSRLDFIGWCATSGAREYGLLRECAPFWEYLSKPAFDLDHYPQHDAANAISWLMVLTAIIRPDLNAEIETSDGRAKLLLWYLRHGLPEASEGPYLSSWQKDFLLKENPSGINNHQDLLHKNRQDLNEIFDLKTDTSKFCDWYSNSEEFSQLCIAVNNRVPDVRISKIAAKKNGVNIIGYISEISGIAEDSRMLIKALSHTTIPIELIDYTKEISESVTPDHRYSINIFCFPVLEHARFLAERGLKKIIGHYNIGYWPWELSHWPEQWRHFFSIVDEIWSSSEHTRESINSETSIPVLLMPMAVEIPSIRRLSRKDFSLPSEKFLFYFSYDLKSSSKRKNPEACINAFLKAFPQSLDVGLVIKTLIPANENEEWESLKHLVQNDRRIHLISQTLSRSDLIDLYALCDCFISLHRAEGFGRNIAEAMLLKRPVIVTNYSGNCSFTSQKNSIPIDYKLIEIIEGDYPYVNKGLWADPNEDDAASAMLRVFKDQTLVDSLTSSAEQAMKKHSSFIVAKNYLSRIQNIYLGNKKKGELQNELV